jgi:hypothetical protein
LVPENSDWDAEYKWSIETGFTQDAYIGNEPFDLPNIIKGKKKRPLNGVYVPVALNHLRLYRNPKTKERIAIFHEYHPEAEQKYTIMQAWCEENGLLIKKLDYSWYYPGVSIAFAITAK